MSAPARAPRYRAATPSIWLIASMAASTSSRAKSVKRLPTFSRTASAGWASWKPPKRGASRYQAPAKKPVPGWVWLACGAAVGRALVLVGIEVGLCHDSSLMSLALGGTRVISRVVCGSASSPVERAAMLTGYL